VLAHITVSVFESLPELVLKMWGFNIPVPLTGDVEYGKTYGDLKVLPREKYM